LADADAGSGPEGPGAWQLPASSFADVPGRHPQSRHKAAWNTAIGAANLVPRDGKADLAEVEVIEFSRVALEGAVSLAPDVIKDGPDHRLGFCQAVGARLEQMMYRIAICTADDIEHR
jgi:hypothetical protein